VSPLTQTADAGSAIASRRILRLALGTAMAMGFSQLFYTPLSFIAAVFTMFVLAVPLPAPTLKSGLKFVLALVIPAYIGMLLIPFLMHTRWAGVILVILALFGSFYYSAKGGSPIMGMFMTVGITMVVTVGSVSPEAMIMVINGMAVGAAVGIAFVAFAHALLPDIPPPQSASPAKKPPPAKPSGLRARRNALRSLTVVLPLVIIFLFVSSSTSYVVVMIKVASMGQQANAQASRTMGKEQMESTLWGGLGALIGFQILTIWPSLLMLCLVIAIACLLYGSRIFKGPGMHPRAAMWSYALLTMIIILTPALTSDGDASAAFYTRMGLFIVIAIYGTIAVAVFDTFWPDKKKESPELASPNGLK